jgi:L-fucose isomerase-like protein
MVLINFKASTDLLIAINNVANKRSTGLQRISTSEIIRNILMNDTEIKRELKEIKKNATVKQK